jgi:hypothetical protein
MMMVGLTLLPPDDEEADDDADEADAELLPLLPVTGVVIGGRSKCFIIPGEVAFFAPPDEEDADRDSVDTPPKLEDPIAESASDVDEFPDKHWY